jgi:hypothetical protein
MDIDQVFHIANVWYAYHLVHHFLFFYEGIYLYVGVITVGILPLVMEASTTNREVWKPASHVVIRFLYAIATSIYPVSGFRVVNGLMAFVTHRASFYPHLYLEILRLTVGSSSTAEFVIIVALFYMMNNVHYNLPPSNKGKGKEKETKSICEPRRWKRSGSIPYSCDVVHLKYHHMIPSHLEWIT